MNVINVYPYLRPDALRATREMISEYYFGIVPLFEERGERLFTIQSDGTYTADYPAHRAHNLKRKPVITTEAQAIDRAQSLLRHLQTPPTHHAALTKYHDGLALVPQSIVFDTIERAFAPVAEGSDQYYEFWRLRYILRLRPGSKEEYVFVHGATLTIDLLTDGMVSRLQSTILPIKEPYLSKRFSLVDVQNTATPDNDITMPLLARGLGDQETAPPASDDTFLETAYYAQTESGYTPFGATNTGERLSLCWEGVGGDTLMADEILLEYGYYFNTKGEYIGRVLGDFSTINEKEISVYIITSPSSKLAEWLNSGGKDHGKIAITEKEKSEYVVLSDIKLYLFIRWGATVYGESTPTSWVSSPDTKEYFALASAIRNTCKYVEKMTSASYEKIVDRIVTVQGFSSAIGAEPYNRFIRECFKTEYATYLAAVINAQLGWTDYSNGATHWDGKDMKLYYTESNGIRNYPSTTYSKFGLGGFTTYLWNPTDKTDIEDANTSYAKVFFDNCKFQNRTLTRKPACRYPEEVISEPKSFAEFVAFRAVAVYNQTIFWKFNTEQYDPFEFWVGKLYWKWKVDDEEDIKADWKSGKETEKTKGIREAVIMQLLTHFRRFLPVFILAMLGMGMISCSPQTIQEEEKWTNDLTEIHLRFDIKNNRELNLDFLYGVYRNTTDSLITGYSIGFKKDRSDSLERKWYSRLPIPSDSFSFVYLYNPRTNGMRKYEPLPFDYGKDEDDAVVLDKKGRVIAYHRRTDNHKDVRHEEVFLYDYLSEQDDRVKYRIFLSDEDEAFSAECYHYNLTDKIKECQVSFSGRQRGYKYVTVEGWKKDKEQFEENLFRLGKVSEFYIVIDPKDLAFFLTPINNGKPELRIPLPINERDTMFFVW